MVKRAESATAGISHIVPMKEWYAAPKRSGGLFVPDDWSQPGWGTPCEPQEKPRAASASVHIGIPVAGCRRRAWRALNWRGYVSAAAVVLWWGRKGAVGA